MSVSSTDNTFFSCALAYALAKRAQQHSGIVMVIVPDMHNAYQLEAELPFFLHGSEIGVYLFPDWETLPYDVFSPHQDLTSRRLRLLSQLPHLTRGIVIAAVRTLMQPVPSLSYVQANSLVLAVGDHFDLHQHRLHLEQAGYQCVSQVSTPGEFAIRGSILDIFPMGSIEPYRIDWLDVEIDSIRTFDPETQRSLQQYPQVTLLPAREYPLEEASINRFSSAWIGRFPDHLHHPILTAVEEHHAAPGVEYYLPLFFDKAYTLLDHLPPSVQILSLPGAEKQAQTFWETAEQRYAQYQHDRHRPLLPPAEVFTHPKQWIERLKKYAHTVLSLSAHSVLPDIHIDSKSTEPFLRLKQFMQKTAMRILFCCESPGRREMLLQHLGRIELSPKVYSNWLEFVLRDDRYGIILAPLDTGALLTDLNIALITENQLFNDRVMQRRQRATSTKYAEGLLIRDISELKVGDAVVHVEHGIGRYQGLSTLSLNGQVNEFLTLHYAGEDKLYVPMTSLHLVSRYSSHDLEHAPLHKLGNDKWQKEKSKALKQLRDVAAELLDVYAKREAKQGFRYPVPDLDYQRFVDQFSFEETPDQAQAIAAVLQDMQLSKPMDRLLCGDVGFGKTEVALRAAYLATQAGKQVAVLVPTTLLAQQHYTTFSNRFADWAVKVEVLSRFKSSEEQTQVLKKLTAGEVDIIIGTHRLLGKGVQFKNLGLLIIDEEHRFGVTHKEKLKTMRTDVDILTMTATPIPRTLNMAMSQIRDLSIIATPPPKRLAVKTFIQQSDDMQIQEAILREINRGGQIFFLHNSVDTIATAAQHLQQLVPGLRVVVAHGQMPERQLEQVMADFYHNRYQVLVSTTIIENGIDIPNANTLIVDRADRFGLAQLHQLRGRVGRSHHQAYAYFFTPPDLLLTDEAQKRFHALAAADTLGAGFAIASHDLEIRGAGELLGDEQSGHIQSIGFSLYVELLEQTVKALQQGKELAEQALQPSGCEVNLQISCLIPEDYLPDVPLRLQLYKRIAHASTVAALDEVQVDMIDRFGLLPDMARHLFSVAELRIKAQALGIHRIDATAKTIKFEFSLPMVISPDKILRLIQQNPDGYRMHSPQGLTVMVEMKTPEERIQQVSRGLEQLAAYTHNT